MTRRDFTLVATVLHTVFSVIPDDMSSKTRSQRDVFDHIYEVLSNALQKAYPNFDRVKFHAAVYKEV